MVKLSVYCAPYLSHLTPYDKNNLVYRDRSRSRDNAVRIGVTTVAFTTFRCTSGSATNKIKPQSSVVRDELLLARNFGDRLQPLKRRNEVCGYVDKDVKSDLRR
jgi:hypothetical protein